MITQFTPTRSAGLARLARFLPHAGWDYAKSRNFDRPDATARLSPWLRHRLITEAEVITAVVNTHGPHAAEKFIQEVFWRSYWKGWLEQRPGVWADYRVQVQAALNQVQTESGLRDRFQAACLGQTGIACFDHWARELADTGYMHNHARMWFASIWIFTLRLPWSLGADLFLRQLLDGDAASNTLSWRWVAGLQTRGKHYVATAENIARFTDGRFDPAGQLNKNPDPLDGPEPPRPTPIPQPAPLKPGLRTGVLLHDEDLSPLGPVPEPEPVAHATLNASAHRSLLKPAMGVQTFSEAALGDSAPLAFRACTARDIADWAARHDLAQIVLPYAPIGPVADIMAQLGRIAPTLHIAPRRHTWDSTCWPLATAGFFKFRNSIPELIQKLMKPDQMHS